MALIQLTESKIVDSSQIVRAERCGNYTDVWLKSHSPGMLDQIWDEDRKLWNAIQQAMGS